jgi:hypothetical protein
VRLRQGRKVPRNLYLCQDEDPDGDGRDAGRVDHAGLALILCVLVSEYAPECVVLCDQECHLGAAHCRFAHYDWPCSVPGWHPVDECPWVSLLSRTAATGRTGEG